MFVPRASLSLSQDREHTRQACISELLASRWTKARCNLLPKPPLNARAPAIVAIRDPRDVTLSWCLWNKSKDRTKVCDDAYFYQHLNCTVRNAALFYHWCVGGPCPRPALWLLWRSGCARLRPCRLSRVSSLRFGRRAATAGRRRLLSPHARPLPPRLRYARMDPHDDALVHFAEHAMLVNDHAKYLHGVATFLGIHEDLLDAVVEVRREKARPRGIFAAPCRAAVQPAACFSFILVLLRRRPSGLSLQYSSCDRGAFLDSFLAALTVCAGRSGLQGRSDKGSTKDSAAFLRGRRSSQPGSEAIRVGADAGHPSAGLPCVFYFLMMD